MVVAILIILLIVGVALVGALYSSFLVFYGTFSDTVEYNKAYYAAVSSLERASLVLRYRSPGYEGSWGRLGNDVKVEAHPVDLRMSGFSFFSSESPENGILWEISSRTTTIPKEWEGNVEWMLATGDSFNFNMLDYVNAENITLQKDALDGHPYHSGTLVNVFDWANWTISGTIRLPKALRDGYGFGKLQDGKDGIPEVIDIGQDGISDDAVVDWSFRGTYLTSPFQVMPTTAVQYYGDRAVIDNKDSLLRESRINNSHLIPLTFGGTRSPFAWSKLEELTVISAEENTIASMTFSELMKNTSETIFRISLLNLLYATSANIYPYLEYQFSFFDSLWPKEVSDRFYTITAIGQYGNYEVKLLVKKPTIRESILWSFTVIF